MALTFDGGIRSEEDNDPLTDDAASGVSITIAVNRAHTSGPSNTRSHLKPSAASRVKHQLAASLLSDSDGVDSPTYDGDVESSATAGGGTYPTSRAVHYHHHTSSSTSTLGTDEVNPRVECILVKGAIIRDIGNFGI
jgi:choline-phosphate cytidylyltransferase